jgi:hypothetical protein
LCRSRYSRGLNRGLADPAAATSNDDLRAGDFHDEFITIARIDYFDNICDIFES